MLKRLTRITKRAVWAIRYQIQKGDFKPISFELGFDGSRDKLSALNIDFDSERSMKLRGQIDRIDAYEDDETLYLTVVDYKSGNKQFDMAAVYYGLQLQLLIYLNASQEISGQKSDKRIVPAGMFYFYIDDPIVKDTTSREKGQLEKQIIEQLKLEGIVLDELDIIKRMDKSFDKDSDVIPVALKQDMDFTKASRVISRENMALLQSYTSEKSALLGNDIIKGEIDIAPCEYKKIKSCDYCSYQTICQFEDGVRGNSLRKLSRLDSEEVLELIKKE